ncbi:MAG: hypothetical protein ACHQHN_11880 [Sphingobacteriales bacterium]
MKKSILPIAMIIFITSLKSHAQWLNPNQLSNLNTWSNQAGFIGWYGTTANAPASVYGSGITMVLPGDTRFGTQLVAPVFDNQLYYRQNQAGNWSSWSTLWSTNNFNPDDYLDRSVPEINASGAVNSFVNGYTFAYATSGTPWNGSLISYGGFGGDYDTQINSDYAPAGGKHISFRTMNGDIQAWNPWYEFYHSGNLNRSDADFTARTITCTNVYTNGNIWSKQIIVALTNPWADYVFSKNFKLAPLSKIKTYIDQNHHLPGMPSAAEVKSKGLNLGEMNRLLTQKVEELTLYLIEEKRKSDKENAVMHQQMNELRQQFSALKRRTNHHHIR